MVKVTFIEPPKENGRLPVERVFGCTYSLYAIANIFDLYVAGILKKNGITVSYKDAAAENISRKNFLKFIAKDKSGIYYIQSVNLSRDIDIALARDILKLRENASIIFAGPGPTYYTEEYIYDERIYVIRGEAEITALEIVNKLKNKENTLEMVRGLSFMRGGRIVHNATRPLVENLDTLPYPAREITEKKLYYNPKLPGGAFTPLVGSRNCPYACIFCVPNSQSFAAELEYKKHFGEKPPLRLRSPENIIEEMREIKEAGYGCVSIIDDQFLWNEERTLKICDSLKGLGIKWGCLARCDRISERVCRAMGEAGCEYVDLGVESFSRRVLDYIKKGLKARDIYESLRLLKKYRIKAKINMLLGTNPFETKEDLLQAIDECVRLKPDAVMFSIASPFPGTEFYEIAMRNNWLKGNKYEPVSVQHGTTLNLPNLSQKTLKRIIKKANMRFYLRPEFFIKNIFRITDPKNLACGLKAFYRKLLYK